jgi:bla regulator protein blaR1
MKKLLFAFISITLLLTDLSAQEIKIDSAAIAKFKILKPKPIYFLDGKQAEEGLDINSIEPKDIEKMEILNEEQAKKLYGNKGINGAVLITTKTKKSNQSESKDGSIKLRNVNQTSASSPLVILDDVEISSDKLSSIKSEDIESVTVLKEKSALEPYGEKGKNGVVLITSKNRSSRE